MNKTLMTILALAATTTAFAEVTVYQNGYGRHASYVVHTEFKHVPLTVPDNHETYNKNLAEKKNKPPKETVNVPAKQEAERADDLRYTKKYERLQRPTISVYSNVTKKVAETKRTNPPE